VRDVAAELLAEHDRHRRAARSKHGMRPGVLRVPGSAAEAKMLSLIRKRLAEHGEGVCRHVLAVLAADWLRDDSQLRPDDWSNSDAVWSTNFEKHREREVGSVFRSKRVEVKPAAKPRRFVDSAVYTGPPLGLPPLINEPEPPRVEVETDW
jgi:hypothetical protein